MSERIVSDPSQHGWVEVNGKWVWDASGGSGGSIQDGDTEGQITTWSGTEWTPEGAVVVDANGNVLVGTNSSYLNAANRTVVHAEGGTDGAVLALKGDTGDFYIHSGGSGGADTSLVNRSSGSMKLYTSNKERMTIDADGTTTIKNDSSWAKLRLEGPTGHFFEFKHYDGTDGNGTVIDGGTGSLRHFTGGSERMHIDANGRVDITGSLYVNGTEVGSGGGGLPDGGYTYGWTITASDFIATSDERLKDNISPLPVGLIDDIKPVQWSWKDGSGKSAGVIAQQLQAIGLDDFVNEDADGNLGVNYNALVGVLLAEVISLKAEVEALK